MTSVTVPSLGLSLPTCRAKNEPRPLVLKVVHGLTSFRSSGSGIHQLVRNANPLSPPSQTYWVRFLGGGPGTVISSWFCSNIKSESLWLRCSLRLLTAPTSSHLEETRVTACFGGGAWDVTAGYYPAWGQLVVEGGTGEVEERRVCWVEGTSQLTSSSLPIPHPTPTSVSRVPSSLPVSTGGRGRSALSGPLPWSLPVHTRTSCLAPEEPIEK